MGGSFKRCRTIKFLSLQYSFLAMNKLFALANLQLSALSFQPIHRFSSNFCSPALKAMKGTISLSRELR